MLISHQKGSILFVCLIATGLFFIIFIGILGLAVFQYKLNLVKVARSQALHIAEAGVNYYRWVLYHDHQEYCNGEACLEAPDYGPYGPYEYTDSAGQGINGYYELYIIPPEIDGSTIVTIKSVGWVAEHSGITRTIEVRCGIPAWSSYSVLADADIRFGTGTEVWGPLHSNAGIRFDGYAHHVISSATLDYDDPDHEGANEFGVHTHVEPVDPLPDGNNPPENVPERPDVFAAGRSFPDPSISFDLLNAYVNNAFDLADEDGLVITKSNREGYHITINPDNTLDIYEVEETTDPCSVCINWGCLKWKWWGCQSWGCLEYDHTETYGIAEEEPHLMGVPIPDNGLVFVKDRVWVDGQIDEGRLTILAFADPIIGDETDIIINNDLTYTNYDGTDAIGLIAQRNITIGFYSEDNLQIDAALIAKEGRVGRDYYYEDCGSERIRDTITINGALATRERYGFAYTDGTGYQIRNLIYDNNLTFAPPPHYPTTGEYTFISWDEE